MRAAARFGPSRGRRLAALAASPPPPAAGGGYQSGYSSVMSFADVIRPSREGPGYEEDGVRTDGTGNTGHQRSLTVNNGHSKTGADQGRNALTRVGEDSCKVVRFPPAPQNVASTRGNAGSGRRDRSPVQLSGRPGRVRRHRSVDQVLDARGAKGMSSVRASQDGIRTDDVGPSASFPLRDVIRDVTPVGCHHARRSSISAWCTSARLRAGHVPRHLWKRK
jgi:hypothetical protein